MHVTKRYREQQETAAEPPAVEAPKPAEQPETQSPAAAAATSAIQARLAEMQNAERLVREAQQPHAVEPPAEPPQIDAEELIAAANIPNRAKSWLRQHPEYVTDRVKNGEIMALHNVAVRQASGEEFTDTYFQKMEDLLGIAPATNGQVDVQGKRKRARSSVDRALCR